MVSWIQLNINLLGGDSKVILFRLDVRAYKF